MVAAAMPKTMTIEEFAEINEEGKFDLVDGEVWFAPPAEIEEAEVIPILSAHLVQYARESGQGRVYGSRTGFALPNRDQTVVCVELAYVKADRLPPSGTTGFFPGQPDLAVMIVSPHETSRHLVAKQAMLLTAGTSLIWAVFTKSRAILIYDADLTPEILGIADTLTGGAVLPGFALPLATLFED